MDDRRFDALTRVLAGTRSRRKLISALVGGVAGAFAARTGVHVSEAVAIPCCGVCPPPCHCVCGDEGSFCECDTCEPTGCGGSCGMVDDGCGGVIDCGCCLQGCNGRCGVVDDECGGTIDCGCCPSGCDGRCGTVDDGCGGTLDCGCCPTTCDGHCGVILDGCGGSIECGGCPSGQTCEGDHCVVTDQGNGNGDNPPEPVPDTPTGDSPTPTATADTDAGNDGRYVVLLDGFGSSSLLDDLTGSKDPDNHGVRERFAPLVERLQDADTAAQIVYFSYRAGPQLASESDPAKGWTGKQFGPEREPVYRTSNVTDRPLLDHVKGLDWMIAAIREQSPAATVDLVGFGLGGVVALAWVADRMQASAEAADERLAAVRRVVLIDSPIAGLNPRAVIDAGGVEELTSFKFDTGNGALVADLLGTSELMTALPDAARQVNAASIENRDDYIVNGEPIFGMGIWLGKGAEDILPEDRRYVTAVGATDGNVLATHRLVLESPSAAAEEARDHLVSLLAE